MTILTAMQSAAARLVGRRPTAFFASQDAFEVEISDLVTEAAIAILKAHDWRKLTKLHTVTGDGSTVAHNLPSDYDRMPKTGDVHSATWETWRYSPARDLDQWIDIQTTLGTISPGFWIVLAGKMQIYPAIPTGDVAKFYYIANTVATGKAAFTSDDDEFLLDDRLLTLGLIWRWRAQKRLEYAEDLSNYEIALSEAIGTDKGSRVLAAGRRTGFGAAREAYPRPLG